MGFVGTIVIRELPRIWDWKRSGKRRGDRFRPDQDVPRSDWVSGSFKWCGKGVCKTLLLWQIYDRPIDRVTACFLLS